MFPINRKTVGRYWNEYVEQQILLEVAEPYDITTIQEKICAPPAYHSENRSWRKYSKELDEFIDKLLEDESEKCKLFGTRKQQLTQLQFMKW